MFSQTKNAQPEYSYIFFNEALADPFLISIPGTEIEALNESITAAITAKKYDQADKYAKKMTIYYGVPGLLYLFDLGVISMQQQKAIGETVGTQAFKVLTNLYLAKIIYENDPNAKAILAKVMPQTDLSKKTFWVDKINVLYGLDHNLRKHDMEARKVALNIFQRRGEKDHLGGLKI